MYKEGAVALFLLGYNGIEAFAIEIPRVAKRKFDLSKGEKIEEV